jgi:hypothetical protein
MTQHVDMHTVVARQACCCIVTPYAGHTSHLLEGWTFSLELAYNDVLAGHESQQSSEAR